MNLELIPQVGSCTQKAAAALLLSQFHVQAAILTDAHACIESL
jgi:hypothetical protein